MRATVADTGTSCSSRARHKWGVKRPHSWNGWLIITTTGISVGQHLTQKRKKQTHTVYLQSKPIPTNIRPGIKTQSPPTPSPPRPMAHPGSKTPHLRRSWTPSRPKSKEICLLNSKQCPAPVLKRKRAVNWNKKSNERVFTPRWTQIAASRKRPSKHLGITRRTA